MSARINAGAATPEYLRAIDQTTGIFTGGDITLPFTVAAWARETVDTTGTQAVVGLNRGNTNNHHFSLNVSRGATNVDINSRARARGGGSDGTAASPEQTGVINQWLLCVAVFESSTLRRAYCNSSTPGADDVTASTPTSIDSITIGSEKEFSDAFADLDIAEVAIWSSALSDSDVLALLTQTADTVQPGTLEHYWPLVSNPTASVGGIDLIDPNANVVFNAGEHPPVGGATGPVLTVQETDQITETTARGNCATDTIEGTMWAGVYPFAATPSAADVKAGTGAVWSGNQAVSGSPVQFSSTGLTENVSYNFWFVQDDSGANESNLVADAFNTANIAPTIVANPTTAITSTTATGNVTTNEQNGTIWGGVWPSGSTPSVADIKAGTGAIAGTASSQPANSGAFTFPVVGLTEGTDYLFFFVQTDAATNDSNIDSDAFTTTALVRTSTVRLSDIDGVDRANLTGLTWSWFDALPATGTSPTDSGAGETTDGSGNLSVTLTNTGLSGGQTGYLLVRDAGNGWQGIYQGTVVET